MKERNRFWVVMKALKGPAGDLARPGRIRDLTEKLLAQVRYRLIAFTRPRMTIRRHRALKGKTIVVYTLGKVGSSSVYNTLVKSFPFRKIFHVHFLSREWLERRLPGTPFAREIRSGRRVLSALRHSADQTLYICMVRDPVARDLSNVIQNYASNGIDIEGSTITEIIARLNSDGHKFGDLWFTTEFANHIGRDILSFAFDKRLGYAIHRIDETRQILLLRLEGLNDFFNEAISRYVGVDVDPPVRINESSRKPEAAFYNILKKYYRVPESELQNVYGSATMRHFYKDSQIAEFTARWRAG